jgi:EAL domain-containing protein (putative c-di-GMP-specific phosphodiesterase class I)
VTAESLPVFFDQAEVSWVREIFRKEALYSVFHPVVHTRSLKPVAFEALIRGTHPYTGEMVSAGELIYACARLNNLDELDTLARDCSIRSAVRISDRSAPIFINYLPNAIGDPEQCFSSSFDEAHRQGIETSRLIFEAVEAESAMSLLSMRETQLYLKSMGARFALDNLGRGHAAVELLEKLNPDFAKLDSNLISTAVVSPRARIELERICLSSQQIETKLIAEGVESIDQMRLCLRCGIELMQGFLFAFPSSPEEATHPIKGYVQPAAA